MTITQNDTSTAIEVGDILAVIDNGGDSLHLREGEIVLAHAVDDKYEGFEQLVSVVKADGSTGQMFAFRFHKLAVGDRVLVTYSKSWDGEGVVTDIKEKLQIICVEMETGELKGVNGGFNPENLTFIEAAPEGKQPIPHGTDSDYGQNVYGFALGDKVLAVGRSAKRLIGQAVEIVELGGDRGWVWVEGVDGDSVDVWLSHLGPLPEPEPKLPYAVGDRVVSIISELVESGQLNWFGDHSGWSGIGTVSHVPASGFIEVEIDHSGKTALLNDNEIVPATIHEPVELPKFEAGDRVVYVGNSDGSYFEPEVVGATGTVAQPSDAEATQVVWDYDTTRRPSAHVFTNNLALASELVATAEEELDTIPTVADLDGFAAINSEGTVLRSVETGYVYGKQGGRWLQLGSTGDASWTVMKAVEVGNHFQVLSS